MKKFQILFYVIKKNWLSHSLCFSVKRMQFFLTVFHFTLTHAYSISKTVIIVYFRSTTIIFFILLRGCKRDEPLNIIPLKNQSREFMMFILYDTILMDPVYLGNASVLAVSLIRAVLEHFRPFFISSQ